MAVGGIQIIILISIILCIILIAFLYSKSNSNNSNKSMDYTTKKHNNNDSIKWKTCPDCKRKVREKVKKCPYCDHEFSEKNYSQIIYSPDGSKICPNCGEYLRQTAINCGYCGHSFTSGNKRITTNHINKNGLSFDYPEYYDIGKYPSSDEAHKSIVALSKNDRVCEIYVLEYRSTHFDDKIVRNPNFYLINYLKKQGYTNIVPHAMMNYCYNARVNSELGNIKTTILFNFKYSNVIMIVGNIVPNSNYDCIGDMKIINNSVRIS
ncbi:zinc ribbon domain-containing protein [uncultured Methanobrevibacter sp.]|uniref:double zinc ribbon domain-containing protein n=1 Tax=uncultured Methanobrevibacter sp. TaxID=253161 RepID=UPI0025CE45BB|nr:zinc ribbon domain-containing protein [uncultured Methanobrevibacter sp.]